MIHSPRVVLFHPNQTLGLPGPMSRWRWQQPSRHPCPSSWRLLCRAARGLHGCRWRLPMERRHGKVPSLWRDRPQRWGCHASRRSDGPWYSWEAFWSWNWAIEEVGISSIVNIRSTRWNECQITNVYRFACQWTRLCNIYFGLFLTWCFLSLRSDILWNDDKRQINALRLFKSCRFGKDKIIATSDLGGPWNLSLGKTLPTESALNASRLLNVKIHTITCS